MMLLMVVVFEYFFLDFYECWWRLC